MPKSLVNCTVAAGPKSRHIVIGQDLDLAEIIRPAKGDAPAVTLGECLRPEWIEFDEMTFSQLPDAPAPPAEE